MEQNDDEIRDYVRFKSSRLMSAALYERLKAVIQSREREERAKSKVLSGALLGLLVLVVFSVLVAVGIRRFANSLILGGFCIWIVYFVVLMRRHLGKRPRADSES
jgi:F0F1-type ATP synthase assembly protein I